MNQNDLAVLQVGVAGKKETFEMAPNRTLFSALTEFCTTLGWDANNYTLVHVKSSKVLPVAQLTVPWRLTGYPNRTTFGVQRRPASETAAVGAVEEVNVALQLPPELKTPRLVAKFPSNTKLWEVLEYWEKEKSINLTKRGKKEKQSELYLQPIIRYISYEVNTNPDLRNQTLAEIGLASRSGVLALHFTPTTVPLTKFLEQDAAAIEEEKAPKPPPEIIDIQKIREERERQEQEKSDREAQAEWKKKVKKQIRTALAEDKNRVQIEEMYQKRVAEEKPKSELEQNIIRREVTSKVLNLPKEGSVEAVYNEELERFSNLVSRDQPNALAFKEREVKYIPASQAPTKATKTEHLPDSFYQVDRMDVKQALSSSAVKEEQGLKPKMIREAEYLQKYSKFKKCTLRIRFPDRSEVHANFLPRERPERLYEFVESILSPDIKGTKWHLFTVPPKKIIERVTEDNFIHLKCVPAALVHFEFVEPRECKDYISLSTLNQ